VNRNNSKPLHAAGLPAARILPALAVLCALFPAPPAGAQSQESRAAVAAQGRAARFVVHSDLVLVPVTVTTGNGRVVPGLGREQFTVLEDKVPQTITHFASEDAPVSIGVVFDASDSMTPRMRMAREAVYALLANAKPADEFYLIRFSTRPDLMVPLTGDAQRVRRATEDIDVGGSTAVLDAMAMAWRQMAMAKNPRKAIVLISDGEDNTSHLTHNEFRVLASENDCLVFAIFMGESPDAGWSHRWSQFSGYGLLEDIAKQAGGCLFQATKPKQLAQTAARIESWIRSQYVLGYVPPAEGRRGGYHKIEVKLARPAGFPKLHSSWRLGYRAPAE
jgi:VWFA-related protein